MRACAHAAAAIARHGLRGCRSRRCRRIPWVGR